MRPVLAVAFLAFWISPQVTAIVLTPELSTFTSTLESYASSKNDIVFVLDESGSIGAENFPAELKFTEMVARLLVVSRDLSRLTVMTFSNDNVVHIDQVRGDVTDNMCKFVDMVNNIPYREGGTRTREALEEAKRILDTGRSGVNKIIVLISDGQANAGSEPITISRILKNEDVIIFGVGVASINRDELVEVASSSSHLYMLTDFEYIKKVTDDLRDDIVEKHWDSASSDLCPKCDPNGICACGAPGGKYQCVCNPGFFGSGTQGDCKRCARGTFKAEAGYKNCTACPGNSTTKDEGSTSIDQCACLLGYEGDPAKNKPCRPVRCAQLSSPQGGSTLPPKCGNTFNTSCHFLCNEGYCPYACDDAALSANVYPWNKMSKEPRICQANQQWSGPEFFCQQVRCEALKPPGNGSINCTSSSLEFGTLCEVSCKPGYNMKGRGDFTCKINGQWHGQMPVCEAITCPALKVNKKLRVSPSGCSKGNSTYETVCQYACKEGFLLIDSTTKQKAEGIRKCLADGSWSDMKQKIICQDISPPVLVNCTEDVVADTEPNSAFSASIEWDEPIAQDNAGTAKVRIVSPPGLTGPPHQFPIGKTQVSYVAEDTSALKSSPCIFNVIVMDNEKPKVTFCPDDMILHHDRREKSVTWEEPTFQDNAGASGLRITKSREPGSKFSWGPSSLVTYNAKDASENNATCSFKVTIKPYPCPYTAPPKHGFVSCNSEAERQYCSVSCDPGYDFVFPPEALYRCKQKNRAGTWISYSGKGKLRFPWPDCAVSKKANKSEYAVDFKFATNSCQISEERKEELKKKFFEKFYAQVKRIPGLCDATRGCVVDNVYIECEHKNKTAPGGRISKRDVTVWDAGATFTRSLKKRDDGHGDPDFEVEFKIRLVVPLHGGLNTTDLLNQCDDCRNASHVHASAAEATALKRVLEAAATEAARATATDELPNAVLAGSSILLVSTCEKGQVSNDLLCVNCPLGTFYENSTTCLPCPIGTYSDKEASTSCTACPNNKTTLSEKASSVSECRALCNPGTFSTTGKEPCTSCNKESYQDDPGQTYCKTCPSGLTTGFWGASSSSSCQDVCPPGMYSTTGVEPCEACQVGSYQPNKNQTSCIKCGAGLSTHAAGSVSHSDCVGVNLCEKLKPCAEGSTCVDQENGYLCSCPNGFEGTHCEINTNDCSDDLCNNGGTCVDGVDTFTCVCLPGYTGSSCEVNIDECSSSPCQNGATCIDGINTFACKCPKYFRGRTCEIRHHDCAARPCLNGGSCFDSVNGYRCCCPKGYTGKTCNLIQKPCSPNPCEHNGTCVEMDDKYQCSCPEGFTGENCEVKVDDCLSNPCQNGGTCVSGIASFTCTCLGLYTGQRCESVRPSNYSLHFPDASVSRHAQTKVEKNLRALTLSFHLRTSQRNERGTPVSYAFVNPFTGDVVDNALTISDPNKLLLYLNKESFDTGVIANDNKWHHCVVTWESNSGVWIFYWDNVEKIRGNILPGGHMFSGVLVIGQDQDELGGAFSGSEAYSGDIAELNMWDYAMSPEEVNGLANACGIAGNVVAWPELYPGAKGNIISNEYAEICRKSPTNENICQQASCHCAVESLENRTKCARNVKTCAINVCQNGQPCVESDNGAVCDCNNNFEGKFCEYDVDECLTGQHNCSHNCVNTKGSHTCSCPPGLHLSEDNSTCIDSSYCTDGLSAHLNGDSWTVGCDSCSCNKGVITCTKVVCKDPSCPEGQVPYQNLKDCCPTCIEELPTCRVFPNGTMDTFDGLSFPLNDGSESTMFQDCVHGDFFGFLRVDDHDKEVRVYIHCLTASLYSNGTVTVNNEIVNLPHRESSILQIVKEGADGVRMKTHHGVIVDLKTDGSVLASIPKSFAGGVCGLCGNMNSKAIDDFRTKHHIPAKSVQEFLVSWRTTEDKHKKGGYPHHCQKRFLPQVKRAVRICKNLSRRGFSHCYKHLANPKAFYDACLSDMCSCDKNMMCYCDAFASLRLACERYNISYWAIPGKSCERQCPKGMTFQTCGPAIVPTCYEPDVSAEGTCIPGCFCPPGKLWHNDKCLEREECSRRVLKPISRWGRGPRFAGSRYV